MQLQFFPWRKIKLLTTRWCRKKATITLTSCFPLAGILFLYIVRHIARHMSYKQLWFESPISGAKLILSAFLKTRAIMQGLCGRPVIYNPDYLTLRLLVPTSSSRQSSFIIYMQRAKKVAETDVSLDEPENFEGALDSFIIPHPASRLYISSKQVIGIRESLFNHIPIKTVCGACTQLPLIVSNYIIQDNTETKALSTI